MLEMTELWVFHGDAGEKKYTIFPSLTFFHSVSYVVMRKLYETGAFLLSRHAQGIG